MVLTINGVSGKAIPSRASAYYKHHPVCQLEQDYDCFNREKAYRSRNISSRDPLGWCVEEVKR